jgi:hypothetical protein
MTVKEDTSNEITVHDDDPELFEFALKCLYGFPYGIEGLKKDENFQDTGLKEVIIPIGIFKIADKYDIPELRKAATQDLQDTLRYIDKPDIFEAAINTYYAVYHQKNSPIGQILASEALDSEFQHHPLFDQMMQRYPVFGADMALSIKAKDEGLLNFTHLKCFACESEYAIMQEVWCPDIHKSCPHCSSCDVSCVV